jgi:protein-disulfide isomerase
VDPHLGKTYEPVPLTSAPVPSLRDDDHVRGRERAPHVLLYADFTCPRCALWWTRLAPVVEAGELRVVFRHLALRAKHPRALATAHAAEAAAAQDAFFAFAEALYADQGHVDDPHLWARCEALGLDVQRFEADRRSDRVVARVARDVRDALRAGAVATPTAWAGDDAGAAILDEIGLTAGRTGPGIDGRAGSGDK